jgi:hypothetical protein
MKVDQMKNYMVSKFNLKADRIITGVNDKIVSARNKVMQSKAGRKAQNIITQIMKL